MKLVGVRVLKLLSTLKEYFLKFVPRQKSSKFSPRYDRIVEHLTSPLTESYIAFMVFVSQDFEEYLRIFQYDQPIINMLWPKMIEVIRSLMSKFVSKRNFYLKEFQRNLKKSWTLMSATNLIVKSLLLSMLVHVQKWSLLVLFRQKARK